MTTEELILKYNVPAPRYTSYPAVPLWNKEVAGADQWMQIVEKTFKESNASKGISLYIHLPFCESLCTYCGCNTRITKNHQVEEGYIASVLKEWQVYRNYLGEKPVIRELHLGGGTPTFFSPANLRLLLQGILEGADVHPGYEFSFEGHPNNTTRAHLETLHEAGFKRVSFGIQDLDLKVQQAIHRIQPFENVQTVCESARKTGYRSINFDLIYGLPFQSVSSIARMIDRIAELMPDRIAFYSYAHVPWLRPGQRGYAEEDLPGDENKRQLYETGRDMLVKLGYKDIGMDHFALPGDALFKAAENQELHRNFMGYTVCHTDLLIGLGASAISDAKYAYMQNVKVVEQYREGVRNGAPAILKSHVMTSEDLVIKQYILRLVCRGKIHLDKQLIDLLDKESLLQFNRMEEEGLISLGSGDLQVTGKGKPFIRNIAMVLDKRLREERLSGDVFSRAI